MPVWVGLAAILAPVGRLTPADHSEFRVLVDAIADYRKAREFIERDGLLIVGDKGLPLKHPAFSVSEVASRTITTIGAKFGLSPADRERAKSTGAPSKAPSRADERIGAGGNRARRKTGARPPLKVVAD